MARAERREEGVTIVETAFALPILFMFIFGLLDLGMWTYNSNQATNAAKDGARAAIVNHNRADEVGSPDWNEIVSRVESRLDRDIAADQIDIRCVRPDDTELDSCDDAVVDRDRVEVEVEWDWDLLTPVGPLIGVDEGRAAGVGTMTIVGKPVGTPPTVEPPEEDVEPEPEPEPDPGPVDCVLDQIKVGHNKGSNSIILAKSANKQLKADFWVTFGTNGVERCNGLAVQIATPDPFNTIRSTVCAKCAIDAAHEWVFTDKNEKIWEAGTADLRIYNEFTDVVRTFQVNWG